MADDLSAHPENVHLRALVPGFFGPWLILNLHAGDALNLEDFVPAVLQVQGADVDVVGGETIGLHQTVTHGVAIAGLVALQHHFLLFLDGPGQGIHVGGIAPVRNEVRDGRGLIDHSQLALEAFF